MASKQYISIKFDTLQIIDSDEKVVLYKGKKITDEKPPKKPHTRIFSENTIFLGGNYDIPRKDEIVLKWK